MHGPTIIVFLFFPCTIYYDLIFVREYWLIEIRGQKKVGGSEKREKTSGDIPGKLTKLTRRRGGLRIGGFLRSRPSYKVTSGKTEGVGSVRSSSLDM